MGNTLTATDKESIKKTIEAMSPDELQEVLKALPANLMYEELKKRYEETVEVLNSISSHFKLGEVSFK